MEKILVCITPQSNSERLIDRAAEEAGLQKGELHILNVQKGDNIFSNENSSEMLEQLFSYGTKKGGFVHALAGDDVPGLILGCARKLRITKMVIGEPPRDEAPSKSTGVFEELIKKLGKIKVVIVERETGAQQM